MKCQIINLCVIENMNPCLLEGVFGHPSVFFREYRISFLERTLLYLRENVPHQKYLSPKRHHDSSSLTSRLPVCLAFPNLNSSVVYVDIFPRQIEYFL